MTSPRVPKLPAGVSKRLERLRAGCRRRLGPNGDLKVLSAVLAAFLFFLIRPFAVGNTKTFTVPVRVASGNEKVSILDYSPKSASVTLRGPRTAIDSFDPAQLAMEIREEFPQGEGVVSRPAGAASLVGRGNLRFQSCSVDQIRIELDYTATWNTTNMVAVPAVAGRPVEGGTATVRLGEPVVVVVKGPIRKINEFRDAGLLLPTEPVDVEGKTKSFEAPVAIKIPADSGITSVEPGFVHALVDIAIAVTNRTETAAPVLLKDVEPPPVKVEEVEEVEKVEEAAPNDAEAPTDEAEPAAEESDSGEESAASPAESELESELEPAAEP